jgi:FMN phosphatase YigB (HAD superfamily)
VDNTVEQGWRRLRSQYGGSVTDAVIFDWRGTLVTTLTESEWVEQALLAVGRDASPGSIDGTVSAIARANGEQDRLDGPGVDSDAAVHRKTYMGVFADAGLDPALAESLYAVESNPRHNPFALDVPQTLEALRERGVRVAIVSDVHFDLRPAFDAAGLGGLVDVFTLSFEQGVQKPNPLMFQRTLDALGVNPDDAVMVGDRSRPDGAAVESGITTLLLPPLRRIADCRLHKVLSLCGAG